MQPGNPRHRSPARSPRAGGARSAAAGRASSSLGAAPGPGAASRPAAPALGANCQGSKARVRRAPRARAPLRSRTRTRSGPGWAGTPRSLGPPRKSSCPFTLVCTLEDPSRTLTDAGIPELTLPPGAHFQNPAGILWPPCTCPEPCEQTSAPCTPPYTAKHTTQPRASPPKQPASTHSHS